VGYDTRLSMQTPSVRIPDPKCDGQYLGVPLVFRWEVLSRPSGSAAVLSQTTTTTAHLTPDVAGDWQVVFTGLSLWLQGDWHHDHRWAAAEDDHLLVQRGHRRPLER
jgi:hypothetical protein